MINKGYLITLHILSLISLSIQRGDGLFKTFPGLRIRSTISSAIVLSGETIRCCLMCLDNNGCYGVNVHKDDGICEINTLGPYGYGGIADTNQSWTAYFRSNALSSELMLRATPGIGVSVKDTWLGTTTLPTVQDACISMSTGACNTHYRNPKVDLWSSLPISEVTIELYRGGSKVAFVTFNGIDSDQKSWFSPSRVLNSSWSTLTSSTVYNHFSVDGHVLCSRAFFINRDYGICSVDAGWLAVMDPVNTVCCPGSWDDVTNRPMFLYSAVDSAALYVSGDVDFADVLAVFVKYKHK
ncbi:uncharacterized protein LOC125682410 [Ostrea edulis]|uniref:uncharacterized protein LOC125682410 n=1 Tax=Ostrea edulis TaxID=37623 RepID=UPI0024AF7270|nr:uncharacterized protein LOC125682410 [Ostrea edulis]